MNKIIKAFRHPCVAFRLLLLRLLDATSAHWNDDVFLCLKFRIIMGKKLNLKNPLTFSEKLQWLKLYDHRPEYTIMADKVKAKEYVAKIIGEEHIIPTIGVWNTPEEIDFDALPNQFVMKCNHNSGLGMFICKDKSKVTPQKWEEVKAGLKKGLAEDYYMHGREWPYKNIPRRILAEKFIQDDSSEDLKDYKIFCFNGEPKIIEVDYNRFVNHKRKLYDIDWNELNFTIKFPSDENVVFDRPCKLQEVIAFSKRLSENLPFVRVDFYITTKSIYFGELTFYHGSGFEKIVPGKYDRILGDMIKLKIDIEQE